MPICDNLSRKHRPFFCEKTWQNRGIYTKNKSGEIEKWKGGVHGTKIQQITHNIRPKPQKSSSKAKKFILPGTAPENSLASWQNARTRTHRPRLPASAGKGPPSKCRPVCDKNPQKPEGKRLTTAPKTLSPASSAGNCCTENRARYDPTKSAHTQNTAAHKKPTFKKRRHIKMPPKQKTPAPPTSARQPHDP